MTKYWRTTLFCLALSLPVSAQDRFVNYLMNGPDYSRSYLLNTTFDKRAERPPLKAASQLKDLGISYFELTNISTSRVVFTLLDTARVPIAIVEPEKNKEGKRRNSSVYDSFRRRWW